MNKLYEIKELTKDLIILYVEDEEATRQVIMDILNLLFKEVVIAIDGVQGLEKLNTHCIDIIMTDIQMPKMNGLDMLEQSNKLYPDIPVIITTAFSDQNYLIRSIEIKVDKYLLKPISQEHAYEVLYSTAKIIDNNKKAKELEVKIRQDKINSMSQHIVKQITDSYQNPCIVYTDLYLRYMNDSFCSLFDADSLDQFLQNQISLETLFDQRSGFMSSLLSYDNEHLEKNRVSISKKIGRKIYRVSRKEIYIDENKKPSIIYFFNDITLEEYQKIKIKSYTEMLEELVFNVKYRSREKKSEKPINIPLTPVEKEITLDESNSDDMQKLTINKEENDLLRRSHTHKTTAEEYLLELDDETISQLQELDELNNDIQDSISMLQIDNNKIALKLISENLDSYAHVISLLFEFADLAYAIRSLSTLLASVDEETIDEKMIKKILIILEGIRSDLSDWKKFIFTEQSALDIHYLDSSLFSACLQIELVLSTDIKEMESEEDDLILF